MPKYKSSLCRIKYMRRIVEGRWWCPKNSDIRPVNCADPPKKEHVLEHLIGFAKDRGLRLGITEKHLPDRDWALLALAALKPDHKFFRKDYVPPKERHQVMVKNHNGFLNNLPPGPIKKKFGMVFKEQEEVFLERQLLKQADRLQKNKRRLKKLKAKVESDEEDYFKKGESESESDEVSEDIDDDEISGQLDSQLSISQKSPSKVTKKSLTKKNPAFNSSTSTSVEQIPRGAYTDRNSFEKPGNISQLDLSTMTMNPQSKKPSMAPFPPAKKSDVYMATQK